MKKTVHPLLNFAKVPIPEKIQFANNVVLMMKNNLHFPTPDIVLDDLKLLIDDLQQKHDKALVGGPPDTAAMHQSRKALDAALKVQGKYVEKVAKGDEAIILSAGYKTSIGETKPSTEPQQPANFVAEPKVAPGTVQLSCKKVKNATSYMYVVSLAGTNPPVAFNGNQVHLVSPADNVIFLADTHTKVQISGLTSGVKYNAMVFPIGIRGRGPASQMVSFISQ